MVKTTYSSTWRIFDDTPVEDMKPRMKAEFDAFIKDLRQQHGDKAVKVLDDEPTFNVAESGVPDVYDYLHMDIAIEVDDEKISVRGIPHAPAPNVEA